jgi:hypothetical protein
VILPRWPKAARARRDRLRHLVERLDLNQTNPDPDLPPEDVRSTAEAGPHPFLSDERVIAVSLSMAIDRNLLVESATAQAGRRPATVLRRPSSMRDRQHRLPDAGHRRRQGAAGGSRLDS